MNIKTGFSFLFLLFSLNLLASVFIEGKIVDETGNPLPGATVSIPDLKISVSADASGRFSFPNAPIKGSFLVVVRFVGYKSVSRVVNFADATSLNFQLQPAVIEAKEVVITGSAFSSDAKKNSTSVTSVNKAELSKAGSTNIIDALKRVPGVSQVTTGGGISKPVIRGLSYNRVVTLANGVKQEGQQWGDEHGIEIDQFAAENVEVLRGAASLLYGSDALGGVINIMDPLSPQEGQIKGEFLTNYSGNNGLVSSSAMLQGNQGGFVWRGRYSFKNAYSYKAPDGYIANTGFNESNLSGQLGLNKKWGYTHLDFSTFTSNLGLPDFERNSDNEFEYESGSVLSDADLKSRTTLLPFQNIRHYKLALNSNIILGRSRLKSTFSYQDNQRRELEDSRDMPSLHFDLNTLGADIKYYLPQANGWEPVFGISGTRQKNVNRASELLIPDYTSGDFGVLAYAKKTWSSNTFNAGLRYDFREIRGVAMADEGNIKFSDFSNSFSNLSFAAGFTHEFNDELSFKTNAGSAFRAPNIAELSSDGVHEGTFRYEIGNTALSQERSYSADFSFDYSSRRIDASLGAFNNYIQNFIYPRQENNETIMVDNESYPVFRYSQDNANLYGLEGGLDIHPIESLHFENTFYVTVGRNTATATPLPFIPAASLRNEIRLEPELNLRKLTSTFLTLELNSAFAQRRVDSFESPTNGYSLLNASVGASLNVGKQVVKVSVVGSNLFNLEYYDHLSRFKPGRLDETRPLDGYFNPGRNISLGIFVPLRLTN